MGFMTQSNDAVNKRYLRWDPTRQKRLDAQRAGGL